jgi:hypothetical protein
VTASAYTKRLAVMLFVIVPLTLVVVAIIGADPAEFPSLWERILTVGFLFQLYAPAAAAIVSITHTFAEARFNIRRTSRSVLIGMILGGAAVVPFALSPQHLPTLLYGIIPGGLYAFLVQRIKPAIPVGGA